MTVVRLAWLAATGALLAIGFHYGLYAAAAWHFPFGLDYSEGLIWQQALWLGTPHLYGPPTFPFLVCEYPPLYLIVLRAIAWCGAGMLSGGRAVSILCTLATCCLLGGMVWRMCRLEKSPRNACWAACIAALLPLSLLPVTSWSVLMRVDMLALGLTYAGLFLACLSFQRPRSIYAAMVFFLAAAFTKQIYLSGALAMLPVCLIRSPRHTLFAYVGGFLAGLALLLLLEWQTEGRFLLHILAYTADPPRPRVALQQIGTWLAAYPIYAAFTLAAVIVLWRKTLSHNGVPGARLHLQAIRTDEGLAWVVFLTLYLLLTSATLIAAGKIGASRNYFIEWMCCWCLWIGWLTFHLLKKPLPGVLRALVPVLLLLQLWPVGLGMRTMRAQQFSEIRRQEWGALLARVRKIPGPLLSDDMVLTIQAGREVSLEPGVLLELSRMGLWNEQDLIQRLHSHYFGAVITAYDPGDPTFDARYLPKTQSALLAAYPHVESYGDYRLRMP